MMTFLLAWGAKLLARPALLVGLASAIAIGGLTIKAKIDKGRHEKEVASLTHTIATRDLTIANQQTAITAEKAIVTSLQAQIENQNSAIEAMRLKAQQSEAAANVAAVRAFNQGREEAEKLRRPDTTVKPGAAEMNAWIAERFK